MKSEIRVESPNGGRTEGDFHHFPYHRKRFKGAAFQKALNHRVIDFHINLHLIREAGCPAFIHGSEKLPLWGRFLALGACSARCILWPHGDFLSCSCAKLCSLSWSSRILLEDLCCFFRSPRAFPFHLCSICCCLVDDIASLQIDCSYSLTDHPAFVVITN